MTSGVPNHVATRPRGLRPLATVLAILLLGACGGGRSGDVGRAAPSTSRPGLLVTMKRYGGIAGLTDLVFVEPSGHTSAVSDRAPDPVERQLPPDQLAALRTALERSDFASLQRNYLDRNAADAFQYDITYQGATVTADEGVVPAKLRPVVDILSGLLVVR